MAQQEAGYLFCEEKAKAFMIVTDGMDPQEKQKLLQTMRIAVDSKHGEVVAQNVIECCRRHLAIGG